MGPIDITSLYRKVHGSVNWSTSAYNDVDTGGSSLKRPRILHLHRHKFFGRKRLYRRGSEGCGTLSRGLAIEREGQLYDDEEGVRVSPFMKDGNQEGSHVAVSIAHTGTCYVRSSR